MPWEACQIILRDVIAEVVQKKERIEVLRVPEAECPTQMHARAFKRWFRFDELLYRPNGHILPPVSRIFDVEPTVNDS
jgi:hypothetical protein